MGGKIKELQKKKTDHRNNKNNNDYECQMIDFRKFAVTFSSSSTTFNLHVFNCLHYWSVWGYSVTPP